jgi:hypothetical protein
MTTLGEWASVPSYSSTLSRRSQDCREICQLQPRHAWLIDGDRRSSSGSLAIVAGQPVGLRAAQRLGVKIEIAERLPGGVLRRRKGACCGHKPMLTRSRRGDGYGCSRLRMSPSSGVSKSRRSVAVSKPQAVFLAMKSLLSHESLSLPVDCFFEVRPCSVETKEARRFHHQIISRNCHSL